MSLFRKGGGLEGIRAQAARANQERAHHEHAEHEEGAKDGERAALADLPRIVEAIDKRQNMRVLGFRSLGREAARQGDGEHTWVMPDGFRSKAPGLPHGGRITYGSHGFVEAYLKTLRKELGHPFRVHMSGHGTDARIMIGWKSKPDAH